MEIGVEAGIDAHGAPAPRALRFESRWVAVAERLDRWDGDDYRYYKLRGDDGALYIVRLDEPHGLWRLVMFRRADAGAIAGIRQPKTPLS